MINSFTSLHSSKGGTSFFQIPQSLAPLELNSHHALRVVEATRIATAPHSELGKASVMMCIFLKPIYTHSFYGLTARSPSASPDLFIFDNFVTTYRCSKHLNTRGYLV